MSAIKKSYLLAPNFTFRAEGPIRLGSIIADPFTPDLVLTAMDPARKSTIYTVSEAILSFIHSKRRGGALGAWIEFLEFASVKFDVSTSSEAESRYRMTEMETSYFYPTEEEIKARVEDKKVKRAMEQGLFGSPVYMITGLKVATGFRANSEESLGTKISGGVSADAGTAAGGVQANVGVNASMSSSELEKISFKSKNDIVFAYQLRQIKHQGWKADGVVSSEFLPKAAFLNKSGKSGAEEEDFEIEITDVQEEELTAIEDVVIQKEEMEDETGTCLYFSLATV
ncbi:hypothetical protein EG329_009524 [Mollisiaceae sp. DMI_Dod_QoI]|nr:hypothetical protein EG329_009524 [Helotiales sp. DMI_Dod_QoI]